MCFGCVFVVFSMFRSPSVGRLLADRYFRELFFNFTGTVVQSEKFGHARWYTLSVRFKQRRPLLKVGSRYMNKFFQLKYRNFRSQFSSAQRFDQHNTLAFPSYEKSHEIRPKTHRVQSVQETIFFPLILVVGNVRKTTVKF